MDPQLTIRKFGFHGFLLDSLYSLSTVYRLRSRLSTSITRTKFTTLICSEKSFLTSPFSYVGSSLETPRDEGPESTSGFSRTLRFLSSSDTTVFGSLSSVNFLPSFSTGHDDVENLRLLFSHKTITPLESSSTVLVEVTPPPTPLVSLTSTTFVQKSL